MEHAIGNAPAATHSASEERPGWWWTVGTLLLGGLFVIPALLVVLVPLQLLHVVPDVSATANAWPWPRDDAWAFAAGLGPLLLCGAAYAFGVSVVAQRRGGWSVQPWVLIAPFVVFALPPAGQPDRSAAFWLVMLVLARTWGIRRERRAPRWPVWARIAAGLAALAIAAATLSYQPLHPFTAEAASSPARIDGRAATALPFELRVEGIAGARLLAVTDPDEASPLSFDVRLDHPGDLGRRLAAGDVVRGSLAIGPGFCRDGWAEIRPDQLELRVRALGVTRTQRVDLGDAPAIRCGRR